MMTPYKGKARELYERITGGLQRYRTGTPYKSEGLPLFYVNTKGYLHTYGIEKASFNGRRIVYLIDYLLTPESTLRETGNRLFNTIDEAAEYIQALETEATENYARDAVKNAEISA